jgi:hypothetical protein
MDTIGPLRLLEVVGLRTSGVTSLQVNQFQASIGRLLNTVDEFVAVKASKINRLQQRSIISGFRIAESKGLPRRSSG